MMKIAVIGAGQMGNGIAQVAASAGYEVLMIDIKEEYVDDWYCMDCEHGPMDEKDDKCSRCGTKNSQYQSEEELTGREDEDIESEVEEIW